MKLPAVIFETTSACNLDCRYCYNIWKRPGHAKAARSSYAQMIKTLRRLFSVAEVERIAMSGGEPFLSERFAEVVLFCRMQGKQVTIITNGNAATHDDLTQLNAFGIHGFELPFHSPTPDAHDQQTGTAGSWHKARASIEHLLSIGAPVAGVIVLTRVNAALVSETLIALHGLGVRHVLLNRFNVGGRGIAEAHWLAPDLATIQQAFRQADVAAGELCLKVSSGVCTPRCLVDPAQHRNIAFAFCDPDLERRPITIDAAGDLRYCNHSPVAMANVFSDDLEHAFASSTYIEQWQRGVPRPCRSCDIYQKCFGGCRAAAEQLGLGLLHGDPLLEKIEQPPG